MARTDRPVQVTWRAFELDPRAPSRVDPAVSYAERLAKKYGVAEPQAQQMIDQMTARGAGVGLDFRFDRVQPTNTFSAHRLLAWAHSQGKQDALKERLFLAYMNEGRSVGDHDTLSHLAHEVGLDADEAARVLATEAYAGEVRADQAMAQQLGISGVPFFVLGGRFGISGAQPPEVLVEALTEAGETFEAEAALACGPEGCEVPPPRP